MPDVESVTLQAGKYRFDALTSGPADGHLVVLLHGFPQTARSWSQCIPALASAGYRVVAPNQRGYSSGACPTDVEDYTLPVLADDVLDLASRLEVDRFSVVGHDWGGLVAWQLGAESPQRVASVVSVATAHPGSLVKALQHRDQARRSQYVPLFKGRHAERVFLARGGLGLRALFAASRLPSHLARRYVEEMRVPGRMSGALNWYRANDFRTLGSLGPVTVPTTYVWGDKDPALGPEAAHGTEKFVTGPYDFEVLHGVGHWIPDTNANELIEILLRHLAEVVPQQ